MDNIEAKFSLLL